MVGKEWKSGQGKRWREQSEKGTNHVVSASSGDQDIVIRMRTHRQP